MTMSELIGSILGRYRILSLIGEGGMATVYYAQEIYTHRPVAVKVLLPSARRNWDLVERFRREARNAAQLRHPHIVPVYESDVDGPLPYLVMDYVGGGSLADELARRRGPLPLPQAARILTQIAEALDYAHDRRMLHRDVKPSNVLLTPDGRAMLTDFGIARAAWDSRLTASDVRIGTAAYMAPEQARGLQMDRRTDVYALGVVLYEMVTGRTPFRGNTDAMLYQHVHESPPRPRSLNPSLPPAVERMVLRALEKAPGRRYPSAGALAMAFRRALGNETGPVPAGRAPATVPSSGSVGLAIVAGLTTLAALAIGLAFLSRGIGGASQRPTAIPTQERGLTPTAAIAVPTAAPLLPPRLLSPNPGDAVYVNTAISFSWDWPGQVLGDDQRFFLVVRSGGQEVFAQPVDGTVLELTQSQLGLGVG
jgi:serine/threonine protein kinase